MGCGVGAVHARRETRYSSRVPLEMNYSGLPLVTHASKNSAINLSRILIADTVKNQRWSFSETKITVLSVAYD